MTNRPIIALILLTPLRIPDINLSHIGQTLSGNTKFLKKHSDEKGVKRLQIAVRGVKRSCHDQEKNVSSL